MATWNKFDSFITEVANGTHAGWINADTDTVMFALSNTAPNATDAVFTDITEISGGNGYTAGGEDAQNAASQTGGTITVACTDIVWTASSGAIATFRYVVGYDDTPTSPADPLIGYYDYGSSISPATGETFTLDFGASWLTFA